MKKATAKLIAALEVELAAAIATKNAANDITLDENRFYAACDRVREIEGEIELLRRGKRRGCSITRELVSSNID
jgi:hypothetical protein